MDPEIPVKNSKSMTHTNSCVFRLVLHIFECINLELLMTKSIRLDLNRFLHEIWYQESIPCLNQFHVNLEFLIQNLE